MGVVRANLGEIAFPTPDGPRIFVPQGQIKTLADAGSISRNPAVRRMKEWWAARMMIGGNVGPEPVWSPLDIEDAFLRAWSARVDAMKAEGVLPESAGAGASVVSQRGVYQGGRPENSVQIVVINDLGLDPQRFEDEMIAVADVLLLELRQDSIYLDMQRNGLSQEIIVVKLEA